jgi:hypothetical protein
MYYVYRWLMLLLAGCLLIEKGTIASFDVP